MIKFFRNKRRIFSVKNMALAAIVGFAILPHFPTATVLAQELTRPDLEGEMIPQRANLLLGPWIFTDYQKIRDPFATLFPDPAITADIWQQLSEDGRHNALKDSLATDLLTNRLMEEELMPADSLQPKQPEITLPTREELPVAFGSVVPASIARGTKDYEAQKQLMYSIMVSDPGFIRYAYWRLPKRPKMPKEDESFHGYLKRMKINVSPPAERLPVHASGERINWLHTVNVALQLSQAYISDNWYQGGNSYLAFMGNFMWDVQLNKVYYPNYMLQSTLSYKLALNSTPDDQYHKYSVSQDLFQYNFKAGYKAAHNWFYTLMLQFKTQLLRSYPANSLTRTSSFLSPGELNVGLGMTYSKENARKTIKLSISVAPASYNLKTCIDPDVDPTLFGIDAGRKSLNEFGSNGEVNFMWKIFSNITYTTRLYTFTDYKTFQGDWENTLNFQFNRLFSTQVYAHLRYDSSTDTSVSTHWKKWMLKEILSVGISYTFSSK
ncbi:MAG: DUF3078 domain-containing protein [Candidatus Amulumruptor caecigallinarius]|nr:DUF3078 domain-containing protein [Candidatus Amulumruptor caecigallinarius]